MSYSKVHSVASTIKECGSKHSLKKNSSQSDPDKSMRSPSSHIIHTLRTAAFQISQRRIWKIYYGLGTRRFRGRRDLINLSGSSRLRDGMDLIYQIWNEQRIFNISIWE